MSKKEHKSVASLAAKTKAIPPPKHTLMPVSKVRINCSKSATANKNKKKD